MDDCPIEVIAPLPPTHCLHVFLLRQKENWPSSYSVDTKWQIELLLAGAGTEVQCGPWQCGNRSQVMDVEPVESAVTPDTKLCIHGCLQ